MLEDRFGLKLGPVDRIHLSKLRTWRNDPRIFKWCRQTDVISDLDQEKWFARQSEDTKIQMYAVWDKKDTMLGVCGLTSIDPVNRTAEFSLYIEPESHGVGLGSAALKTLLNHGFRNLNMNVIWGETFEGNKALELFIKLGMKTEGVRRQFYYKNGKYIDAILVSLTRMEWEEKCLSW